jgi:hypothetical protein
VQLLTKSKGVHHLTGFNPRTFQALTLITRRFVGLSKLRAVRL